VANFDLESRIESTLNRGFLKIPDGHKIAVITHAEYGQSGLEIQGAFVMKVVNEWQVQTLVDWKHDGGIVIGMNLEWSK